VLIGLTIVNVILVVYVFILSLRIVLGWIAPQAFGRAWKLLTRVTDPYLKVFARVRFLRGSLFDFSPIAAIIALVVLIDLVNQLLYYGRITLGFFLASVLSAAWSGVWFVLLFFLIVGVLRTIPLGFRGTSGAPLWKVVDMIMKPIVDWVMRAFRLGRRAGYTQHLLLTVGLLLVALLVGEYIIRGYGPFRGIIGALESLPI
jgi:YggT family protein